MCEHSQEQYLSIEQSSPHLGGNWLWVCTKMSLQNHPRENIFPEVSDGQLFQDFQVSQRVEFKVELTMPTSLQENAEEVVMRGDTLVIGYEAEDY